MGLDLSNLLRSERYEEHGWWMWGAWFIAGLLLLITKRYVKKHWIAFHYIHALLGYFVLGVSIAFSLKITNWEPVAEVHNAFGSFTVLFTIFGSLTGSLTAGMMRFYNSDKPWAEKERVEQIAKIHRIVGYLMLFVGNVTIMTGAGHYFLNKLNGDTRAALGLISLLVFCILVAIFEAIYRIRNSYSMGHIKTPQIKTPEGKIKTLTPA